MTTATLDTPRLSEALQIAHEERDKAENKTAFLNAVLGPKGRVSSLFKTAKERQAFQEAGGMAEVLAVGDDLPDATPAAPLDESGKFVVRVPKSLHASLKREADEEGVSLNQLCLSKLSIPLRRATA